MPKIDLLIGGSPCQDFSPLKWINWESKGLEGDKSALFYEYLRLLKEVKPKYFLLENVKMKKESEKQLNEFLGVKGVHINSNLVSYQNRPRIYWTNIPGYELDLFRQHDSTARRQAHQLSKITRTLTQNIADNSRLTGHQQGENVE